MRIVAISDTHGMHRRLALPEGDLLIHAGDCTRRGLREEVDEFAEWMVNQPHPHKVLVAGNHDWWFERSRPARVRAALPDGIHYLCDDGCEIDGLRVWGSPFQPRFFDWAFQRDPGPALARHWLKIPPDTDILITHGPPAGILDCTHRGPNAGCADLRRRVQELEPALHVFGHIHEGYGALREGPTLFVNASIATLDYLPTNAPVVVDLLPGAGRGEASGPRAGRRPEEAASLRTTGAG